MSRTTRDYADRHPRNKAPRKAARAGAARKPPVRGGGSGKASLPAWAWMVVGLSAGLVVAAFVYVGRPAQPMDMAPSTADKVKPKAIELPPKEPSRFAFYEMLPSYEVVVSDEVLNAPPPPKPKPAAPAAAPPPTADDPIADFAQAAPAADKPAPPSPGPQASTAERVAALQAAVAEEERRQQAKAQAQSAAVPKPGPGTKPGPAPAGVADAGGRERYLIQVAAYRSRGDADQQRAALALLGLSAKVEQVTIDQRDTWYRVRVGPYANAAAAESAQRTLQAQGLKGVVMKVKS